MILHLGAGVPHHREIALHQIGVVHLSR
jgi:hypothetical protein